MSDSRPSRRPSRGPAVVAAVAAVLLTAAAPAALAQMPDAGPGRPGGTEVREPATFTSQFSVAADPGSVPAGDDGQRGQTGASGTFDVRLNSDLEIVCFDATLRGVEPPFQSPAATATHIHQGLPGQVGPPVVLLPNPQATGDGALRSSGCLLRPFVDAAFSLAQIEANPSGFYVDNHTQLRPAGSVRGQLRQGLPTGGVEAGAGGTATTAGAAGDSKLVIAGGVVSLALSTTLLAAALLRRRREV